MKKETVFRITVSDFNDIKDSEGMEPIDFIAKMLESHDSVEVVPDCAMAGHLGVFIRTDDNTIENVLHRRYWKKTNNAWQEQR